MNMIKAVYFDFDGVLAANRTGASSICDYLGKMADLRSDVLNDRFWKVFAPLDAKPESFRSYWAEFCNQTGKDIDIRLLYDSLARLPKNEPMFHLAAGIDGVTKGIITDNVKERFDFYKDEWNLGSMFDRMVCSAEFGSTKRGTGIFMAALGDIRPDEAVFIDNSMKNLEVARSLGMHGIFHDDEKNDVPKLAAELKKLGVRITI
jgi:putative hydrolase of the HAD superfamily